MSNFDKARVVLLGTGTPIPDPLRSGPSVAIIVKKQAYLVDCGVGVVRRAAEAVTLLGIKPLQPPFLNRVLLTHLHSDHTLGLPDLIFTPWIAGRKKPLEIYGPIGTQAMADHIVSAYKIDIDERINGLEPANDKGHQIVVHEISPGIIYEDSNVKIDALPVKHGNLTSFAYKFITKDRTIVISGDTTVIDELADFYKGCDVLVHEVYSKKALERLPPNWQKYHSSVHTSSLELAKLATTANPGLLVLYHQLFWHLNDNPCVEEIKQIYNGKVVSGKDLEVY